jgi:hypothetical protein
MLTDHDAYIAEAPEDRKRGDRGQGSGARSQAEPGSSKNGAFARKLRSREGPISQSNDRKKVSRE